MSTKKVTTQSNQYNPASMSAYNSLVPQTSSLLQSYMNNPMQVVSPYFNLATQQSLLNAGTANRARMGNLTANQAALGTPNANPSAYLQSQINAQSRANSANNANIFMQGNLAKSQAALGVQQTGLNSALGFRPLQTGTTQTQQQMGLGSWLPQAIGMGIGLAAAPFTGGASLAGPMSNMSSGALSNASAAMGDISPFFPNSGGGGYAGTAPPSVGYQGPPPSYWSQFGGGVPQLAPPQG